MRKVTLERQIATMFDQNAHAFPDSVSSDDARLRRIVAAIGRRRKVLDVGCGKGRFSAALAKEGFDVHGIDTSREFVNHCKRHLGAKRFRMGSATRVPFPDESFDAVICIETLEHVPDTARGIKEMWRVVRKGGVLIIVDKNRKSVYNLAKRYRESRNQWFYPRGFAFQEKWFCRSDLAPLIPGKSKVQYQTFGLGGNRGSLLNLFFLLCAEKVKR